MSYFLLFTMMTMINSIDLSHRYQTSINGHIISIPKSLLSINNGDYIVNIDAHKINVELQRENGQIQTSINIPLELSDDPRYKLLPISGFIYEIIRSHAAKQNVVVADKELDKHEILSDKNDASEVVDWVTICGVKLAPLSRLLIYI
jgi:hypothetical protein